MKEESKENDNISIQKEKDTSKKDIQDLNKKKKNRTRMILVLLFLLLFAGISYIELRGSYLEYLELGQNYTNIFYTNLTYRYGIMAVNFVILYFILYFTNRGIKKGLKPFFEKEKKEIPKLPNKSLALVISALVSFVTSSALMQKIMLISNGTSFGIQDPIFGLDIAYYMFQKPVIETLALYFVILFVGLSIYIALYYVIAFNRYFDGVDGKMLKESLFMKKLTRNALLIIIGIAILTVINTQNTMFGKILTVKNDLEIVGAGMTETTIKLWGYVIFAFVIIIFAYRALKYFKKGNTGKVLKNLAVIPGYLVVLFIVMVVFDLAFVSTNELDKEKEYIAENIKNTKNAYNINIEEKIRNGQFRSDLYYRLNLLDISIPPLRERREDVQELVDFYLTRFACEMGKRIPTVTSEAAQLLMQYDWPGNVRELRNVCERLIVLNDSDFVSAGLLRQLKIFRESKAREPVILPEEQMEDTVYSRLKPKKKKKELAEELGVSRTTLWRMAKRQSALEQKQREQEISKRRSE